MRSTHVLLPACWRMIAAAVMLVIAAHAAAPFATPLQRDAGSAFSAASSDVSLACGHAACVAKRQAVADLPTIPAPGILPVLSPIPRAVPRKAREWPEATGPPPTDLATTPAAPRAPPAA
ncbi:MAG TPA: hypothetical protein VGE05_02655 [Novosphingobium sp.]